MCGHCGCGARAGATIVNLQTGEATKLAREAEFGMSGQDRSHDRSHAHSHGQGHAHDHHDGHHHHNGHDHDHDHGHHHHGHHHHHHGHDHNHHHGHDHRDHDHASSDAHGHTHHDGQMHDHGHHEPAGVVELEARILAKNDLLAARNRSWFAGREILALNLVSSPGAGKTTLLERTIRSLRDELPLFVIEGDQATVNDGERIRHAGAPAVQVNTGTGCHLEADMVARGLAELKPTAGAVVMIENVGNLVCPAMFDLGEHARIVILSVTEGEDKPLKYPHMFRSAALMILNKTDLLPHLDFDVGRAVAYAREVNPDIEVIEVSARDGSGLDQWFGWIRRQTQRVKDQVFAS